MTKRLRFLIGILGLSTLVATVAIIGQRAQDQAQPLYVTPKAAPSATLRYTPNTATINPNSTQTVDVYLEFGDPQNPSLTLSSVSTEMAIAPNTSLSITKFDLNPELLNSNQWTFPYWDPQPNAGVIRVNGTSKTFEGIPSGTYKLGTLTLNSFTSSAAAIALNFSSDPTKTTVIPKVGSAISPNLVNGSYIVGFTATPTPTITPTAGRYSLLPTTSTITGGTSQTIQLRINTGSYTATSFESVINVTGTSVPSNLTISPITPTGMSAQSAVINITGGKQIQLSVVGGAGSGTLNTNNTWVTVANINYTAPSGGSAIFSLNSNLSTIYAGSLGNILSGTFTETYTYTVVTTPTPTRTPTPMPISPTPTRTPTPMPPSPTPTRTPTPTPTRTPTPVPPTPTPTIPPKANFNLLFRLQGLTNADQQAINSVKLRNESLTNSPIVTVSNILAVNAGASSEYYYSLPLVDVTPGTYTVCVKAKSHLQKCFTNLTVATTTTNLYLHTTSTAAGEAGLRAGDINHDNRIDQEDLKGFLASYSGSYKVPTVNPDLDINNDGYLTILDLALMIMNYTDFIIRGDQTL
jgi:hypothetical protein